MTAIPSPKPISRRALLQSVFLGAASTLLAACGRVLLPAPATVDHAPATLPVAAESASLAPDIPITSNEKFYTVAYREQELMMPEEWQLTIEGNVEHPMTLTRDDILQLPAVVEMRTLCCISNPAGGPLIGNAIWKGVRLRDVLERAGVKPDTLEIYFTALDGYDTSIPLALAQHEHSLLVYEMNGEPLPLAHGRPLRCLFPGRYGMKQPKWLQKITATTKPRKGYWEAQGWTNDAFIKPFSRIDAPDELATIETSTLSIQGVGFSNDSGIKKLDISPDDGATWLEADLTRPPTPYVWTRFEWNGAAPPDGEHVLLARTTDNDGNQQVREQGSMFGSTFPDGTAAMHQVPIRVKS